MQLKSPWYSAKASPSPKETRVHEAVTLPWSAHIFVKRLALFGSLLFLSLSIFRTFFLRRPSWTSELFSAGLFLATYSLLWISVTFIFSPESSCCCGLLVNHFNCIPLGLRQIQDSQLWYSVSFSEPKTYLNRCLIPCVQQVMKEYENGTEVWVIKWENISSPLWLFILPVGLLSGRKGPARI